jgi:DoxX-like family
MSIAQEGAPRADIRQPGRLAGRIITGLMAAFLLADGAMKLVPLQPVIDTTAQLGWPTDAAVLRALGAMLIVSTLLYVHPRTAALGAVLLTAYLGGAIATHARIGNPLFSHTLFGVYLSLLVWGGLWLRSPQLRALLSVRR